MSRLTHLLQHAMLLSVGLVLGLAGMAAAAAGGNFILGVANNSGTSQTGLIANTTFPLHALVVQQGGTGNGGYFVSEGGSGMLGITKSGNRYAMSGTNDGAAGTGGAIIGLGKNNVALDARSDAKPPISINGPTNQAPMTVNSSVRVTNLNGDTVDGYHANAVNRTAFAATDNAGPDEASGTLLSATVTVPARGWIHMAASADSWAPGGSGSFTCRLNVGATAVVGSTRWVTFGTGNTEQDCVTQGSFRVCNTGDHLVTLTTQNVDAGTFFNAAHLQAEFVPFNGAGNAPGFFDCPIVILSEPPAEKQAVPSQMDAINE